MRISLTSDAEHELIEGALYYAREANAELGQTFLSEFERSIELLLEHPKFGAVWRGVTRRLPLRRFPYSIVYELRDDEVRVLAVAHQRRRPGFWKGRA
jgi:plasmid stabilization system protein ParE